jgi:hypothetical protein
VLLRYRREALKGDADGILADRQRRELISAIVAGPDVSVTVPRMAPVSTCAGAGKLVRNSNRAATPNVRDARRINSDTGVLLIAFLLIHSGPTASSTAVSIECEGRLNTSSTGANAKMRHWSETAPAARKPR